MKIKILLFGLLILPLFFLFRTTVYGQEIDNIVDEQLDSLDLFEIQDVIDQLTSDTDNPYMKKFNFQEIVKKAISGQLDMSLDQLIKLLLNSIFHEISSHVYLIIKLVVICILCALLKNLSSSFESKSVGQIAFYMTYIILTLLLLQSFEIALSLARDTIDSLVLIMQAILPTLMTLLMMTGNFTSAAIFHPMILFSIETIGVFIKDILLPIIYFTAVLEIVNHLTAKEVLKQMIELLKQTISWALKSIVTIFIGMNVLQGFTTPILDGVVNKTAKVAVSSVPFVGSALSGAVDTVLSCSVLIKNGVGVGAVLILLIICIIPIIKMLAFVCIYKIIAALIQPISEERIVKCISNVGESCALLLGSLITVMIMFIIAVTILIGVGNINMMMR